MLVQLTNEALLQAKIARVTLAKRPGMLLGMHPDTPAGAYLTNYSQCLLNRQIDIFDDAILLLDNNRVPPACVISRAMIETYAFSKFLANSIEKILDRKTGEESVKKCIQLILSFTNSSRFKVTEQEKVAKGIFHFDDYQFTDQAKDRMLNALATSEHVMNALRSLFIEEMEHTGEKESQFEILYNGLSEWVHPSQTSVFHNYVPATHLIPTSAGNMHLYDGARLACVRALHIITDSETIHSWLDVLAQEITRRSASS